MRATPSTRVAAAVLGVQALGAFALVVWQVVELGAGDADSVVSGIALIVLTLIGAVAVGAFSVGVARGVSWGRSGGIVVQLLILAVALGAVSGGYAHPLIALGLALLGLAGLVPLVLAVRRAGAERRAADKDGGDRRAVDEDDRDGRR